LTPHAVISGASSARIARLETTGIERFRQRRNEGQNVDIRGAAREVVRRMGIDADVRAANTGQVSLRFVKADGSQAPVWFRARSIKRLAL
jgi:hypothetical protein